MEEEILTLPDSRLYLVGHWWLLVGCCVMLVGGCCCMVHDAWSVVVLLLMGWSRECVGSIKVELESWTVDVTNV